MTLKKLYQASYQKYACTFYRNKYSLVSKDIKIDNDKMNVVVVVKSLNNEIVPVFFEIENKSKGVESEFKYRVGADSEYINKKHTNIMEAHCPHFWYGYSNVLYKYGVYLGVNPCRNETKLNTPVFDEFGIWVFELILFPLLAKENKKE